MGEVIPFRREVETKETDTGGPSSWRGHHTRSEKNSSSTKFMWMLAFVGAITAVVFLVK